MILVYLYIFLCFPVIVGILSVNIDGEPFSAIDYIAERLSRLDLPPPPEEEIRLDDKEYNGFINGSNALDYPNVIELPSQMNEGLNAVWAYLWFLGSQSKDLGTWIGVNTAPFHYAIALSIAIVTLFTNQFMMLIAFFYLLITDWQEFKNIRKKDIV